MDTTDPRTALAQAIRAALESAGRSQSWLGATVARTEGRTDPYSQSIVSDWLNGNADLPPARVFLIERALGRRPGSLSRIAGYLPVDARSNTTVADALTADPNLTTGARDMLLAAYRAAVKG